MSSYKWYRQDANSDAHPKIQAAGFWGARAYEVLLRINRDFDLGGEVPLHYAAPEYLARRLMANDILPLEQAAAAIEAGLKRCAIEDPRRQLIDLHEDGSVTLLGWEEPERKTSTPRVQKHREKKRAEKEAAARADETPETSETRFGNRETHETGETGRREEKRVDQKKETSPLPPAAAGGLESGPTAPEARERRAGRRRPPAPAPPSMPTELTPAAARVVAAIQEALGAPEPYPPEACAALEARLRGEPMALTEDQALTVVRWASCEAYWVREVQLAPNKLFAPDRAGELLTRALAVERRRPAPAPEPPKDWEAEEERWDARRWWERLPPDERERVEEEATKRAVQRFGSVHQSCIDRILVEMRHEREAAERRPLEATG